MYGTKKKMSGYNKGGSMPMVMKAGKMNMGGMSSVMDSMKQTNPAQGMMKPLKKNMMAMNKGGAAKNKVMTYNMGGMVKSQVNNLKKKK
jgi:hypothetical protein